MTMSAFLSALTSAAIVSLISLVGIATLPFNEAALKRITFALISLATGALFGDAILHILPDIFRHDPRSFRSSLWVLAGIFISFIFEKILRWKDHHDLEGPKGIKPVGR